MTRLLDIALRSHVLLPCKLGIDKCIWLYIRVVERSPLPGTEYGYRRIKPSLETDLREGGPHKHGEKLTCRTCVETTALQFLRRSRDHAHFQQPHQPGFLVAKARTRKWLYGYH